MTFDVSEASSSDTCKQNIWMSLSLIGSFTPCQHPGPSPPREQTVVLLIQSGADDKSMNQTRRNINSLLGKSAYLSSIRKKTPTAI